MSNISQATAISMIEAYRDGLPSGSLKSIWLDDSIINYIVTNASGKEINGLRIYLAEYTSNIPSGPQAGDTTMIAAATSLVDGVDTDLEDGYFNLGKPCPPDCQGDIVS